jgi:multidrug efflux pump subunit AcrB
MAASYIVAMTVAPIFCARFLTPEEGRKAEEGGHGVLGHFIAAYDRFAIRYERWLSHALNHKLIVIGAAAMLFVASVSIFPFLGTELFPKTDAGEFVIQFRAGWLTHRTH